jgi:hypothetical protein
MEGLFMARDGRIAHFSSYDRTGGNDDFVELAPDETHTLVDHSGEAGIIRRWWVTIAPRDNRKIQRRLIVRCYWDGEEEPSVEVPVSDFFGMGFGEWKDYQSLPLNMTSGGYNSYWPMPFRESARITVENTSDVPVDRFYYNIDVATRTELPDKALYFHAQYRQTQTEEGTSVTILETEGRGHYSIDAAHERGPAWLSRRRPAHLRGWQRGAEYHWDGYGGLLLVGLVLRYGGILSSLSRCHDQGRGKGPH